MTRQIEQMWKLFRTAVIGAVWFGAIYLGFVLDIEPARNLALFVSWFFAALMLAFALIPEEGKRESGTKGRVLSPPTVVTCVGLVVVFAMLGHMLLASLLATGTLAVTAQDAKRVSETEAGETG